MNILIGTHDSGTGEPSKGLLSLLVLPFAKTQSKTICEQYNHGCRLFDFRVRYDNNSLRIAHGLWTSKSTLFDALYSLKDRHDWLCTITYEGSLDNELAKQEFVQTIHTMFKICNNDKAIVSIGTKKPWCPLETWKTIKTRDGFKPINFNNKRWLIPIPWLWDRLYSRPHVFDSSTYTIVDFF